MAQATIQRGIAGTVIDNFIENDIPTTNLGTDPTVELGVGNTGSWKARGLLGFNFSGQIPAGSTITAATLSLYRKTNGASGDSTGRTLNCQKVLRTDWNELQSTWNIWMTGSNWATAGCGGSGTDYTTTNQSQATVPAIDNWINFTGAALVALVQDALDNVSGKLNVRLVDNVEANTYYTDWRSSDYTTDTTLRPKLVITFTLPSGYLSNYPKRMDLVFDTTSGKANVAGNVTNAIVRVSLSAKTIPDKTQRANIFSASETGKKLLFTDSDQTTWIPHEVAFWNNGEQQAILWIKVPQVNGNSNTDKITMFYDYYGGVDYPSGPLTDVCTAFHVVYHYEGTINDSSPNGYNGDTSGGATSLRGYSGLGRHLDAVDDLILYSGATIKNKTQLYVSCWVRIVKAENKDCVTFREIVGGNNRIWFGVSDNPKVIQMGGRDADGGTYQYKLGVTNLIADATKWYYIGGSWDSTNDEIKVWLNGIVDGTNSVVIGPFTSTNPDSKYPQATANSSAS